MREEMEEIEEIAQKVEEDIAVETAAPVTAKKTTKNSITYGDNLPKSNYIYLLRDTKNGVQTFYFGDDIISKEDRDKLTTDLRRKSKTAHEKRRKERRKIEHRDKMREDRIDKYMSDNNGN